MIGKGYADLRDLPLGGTWIGIIRKLACHSFGSRSRSLPINWLVTDTDRRKDRGAHPDQAQGAHEHEAKEHDLPLVRQRRA